MERAGLLRALADQIAITSEIALGSLDAQERIRRYSLLAAIGEIALSKLGMEVMLDSILMRVHDHFDANSVFLYLLGSERSALRTRSIHRPEQGANAPFIEIKAHLISNDKRIGTLQVRRSPTSFFSGAGLRDAGPRGRSGVSFPNHIGRAHCRHRLPCSTP